MSCPRAAAGVGPRTAEALTDPLPHLCHPWLLRHQWLWWKLDLPGKGLEWMGCIYYNGNTHYSPSIKNRTSGFLGEPVVSSSCPGAPPETLFCGLMSHCCGSCHTQNSHILWEYAHIFAVLIFVEVGCILYIHI